MKLVKHHIARRRYMNQAYGMKLNPELRSTVRDDEDSKAMRGYSIEMPPQLAREFADWISAELKIDSLGFEDREVFVTPFPGYRGLAGYVVTINGSPVRGTMLIFLGQGPKKLVLTLDGTRFRRGKHSEDGSSGRRYREGINFIKEMGLPTTAGINMETVGL